MPYLAQTPSHPAVATAAAKRCPQCAGSALARSRMRGPLEKIYFGLLHARPYRCMDCWHRFVFKR